MERTGEDRGGRFDPAAPDAGLAFIWRRSESIPETLSLSIFRADIYRVERLSSRTEERGATIPEAPRSNTVIGLAQFARGLAPFILVLRYPINRTSMQPMAVSAQSGNRAIGKLPVSCFR